MNIVEKDKLTSLEVLKEINIFREQEYQYKVNSGIKLGKVELKNSRYTELKHNDLLKIIRDEFEEEIQQGKISQLQNTIKTNNGGSKDIPYFILTLQQAKQVLLRESKFVRKGVLKYIENLENKLKYTLENKIQQYIPTKYEEDLLRLEKAKLLKEISQNINNELYKETLLIHSANSLNDKPILPLIEVEESTYSATDFSKMALEDYSITISRNMIGKIANENNLKTKEYGKVFYDKALNSNKQVETFRYFKRALKVILKLGGYNID